MLDPTPGPSPIAKLMSSSPFKWSIRVRQRRLRCERDSAPCANTQRKGAGASRLRLCQGSLRRCSGQGSPDLPTPPGSRAKSPIGCGALFAGLKACASTGVEPVGRVAKRCAFGLRRMAGGAPSICAGRAMPLLPQSKPALRGRPGLGWYGGTTPTSDTSTG